MIEARLLLSDLESKDAPLEHHLLGLSYTATGYGRKIPTRTMVRLPGQARWRRVYVCQFSNAGTAYVMNVGADYVTSGKNWIVIG